jgi:hypothetical protein
MDATTLRLVSAAVAVVLGVLVFLRRRSSKTE